MNEKFQNACKRVEQSSPPIWFMRQAGRYHSHYRNLKQKWTFELLCKLPNLASEVALGPIEEFDYDVAILFSDILFPLEGLGIPLRFDPGPKFQWELTEQNAEEHSDIDTAIKFMSFQKEALELTRKKLPNDKSLIGFVGGPWTLMNYAVGQSRVTNKFKLMFMEKVIVPLLVKNINLQLEAGAEKIMIFDSGLSNMSQQFFKGQYAPLLLPFANPNVGYYSRNLPGIDCLDEICEIFVGGVGVDHNVDINDVLTRRFLSGFVQGNFDESKMLLPEQECRKEIHKFCDKLENVDRTGWVCGLGHGINKHTPEENVHMFIDIVRSRF
tara:strand:+ start:471 stop:1448 length:978 start_codon:yes stop_codon:yes gene_type:complete